MTIPSTPRRAGPFVGTGALVSYAFNFKTFDKTEVAVVVADADGNENTLVVDSSVLVTLNPDQVALPGGSVQYAVSGVATALPSGYSLTVLSAVEYKQSTQLPTGGNYRAEVVEQAMDALAVQIQQQQEVLSRTLVFSPTDAAGSTLPPATYRADRLLGFDSAGRVTVVAPASGSAAALATDLANAVSATKGASLLGWLRAATSSVATTLKAWLGWQEINAFEFMTVAQIAAHQAGSDALDLSAPLQAWINACSASFASGGGLRGRLPPGRARIDSSLAVTGGLNIIGSGTNSGIRARGCPVFELAGDNITIEKMALFSYSAGGVADPRTFSAIKLNGTAIANVNYATVRDCFFQGWDRCIDGRYTWLSTFDNLTTVNCDVGVYLFGQSVNNVVSNCRLVVNGGRASIETAKDGTTQGEGLFVTGTLMASGQSAMISDGFLAIAVDASCMADLIQGKAFDFSGVTVFKCDAHWVYSNDTCYHAADLGSLAQSDWEITTARATCAGSATLCYWGSNNNGLKLGGNLYLISGAGYPVQLNGGSADVYASITNGTAQAGVRVATTGNTIRTTGDRSVEWATSPVASVGNASAVTLPRNGCTTFSVVGATNITSIDPAGWDGQEVTLVFTTAITVTDGSNLKLNGNFVTTADDVLKLVCSGANWYEISRSAN